VQKKCQFLYSAPTVQITATSIFLQTKLVTNVPLRAITLVAVPLGIKAERREELKLYFVGCGRQRNKSLFLS
jgi:hypothetical protein